MTLPWLIWKFVSWMIDADGNLTNEYLISIGVPSITTSTPVSPTGVTASDSLVAKVQVIWNSVANATSYRIYRGATSDPTAATLLGTSTITGYDDTTASATVVYYYWVTALNSVGESAKSDSDTGVAAAQDPGAPVQNELGVGSNTVLFPDAGLLELHVWAAGGGGGFGAMYWDNYELEPLNVRHGHGGGGGSGSYARAVGDSRIAILAGDQLKFDIEAGGAAATWLEADKGSNGGNVAVYLKHSGETEWTTILHLVGGGGGKSCYPCVNQTTKRIDRFVSAGSPGSVAVNTGLFETFDGDPGNPGGVWTSEGTGGTAVGAILGYVNGYGGGGNGGTGENIGTPGGDGHASYTFTAS